MTVACSVLYRPFSELDLDEPYGAPPESAYYDQLIELLDATEREIERPGHVVVRRAEDLERARQAGKIAFVHCIEGGFHLGATPEEVNAHVHELAARGVPYITLAHLFWRRVATNAPALPFLPDALYNLLFPQKGAGALRRSARRRCSAMYASGIVVDISHMRDDAIDATFALLDDDAPVIASHAGYRFGGQKYNLTDATIARIAARGGVVGLIFAQHQINDGLRRTDTKTLAQSLDVLDRHIDAIGPTTSRSAPTSTASSSRRSAGSRPPRTSSRSPTRCACATREAAETILERKRAARDRPAFRQRSTLTPRISMRISPRARDEPHQHGIARPGSAAPCPCRLVDHHRAPPARSRRSPRRSRSPSSPRAANIARHRPRPRCRRVHRQPHPKRSVLMFAGSCAERDQVVGHGLDEGGRPADVRAPAAAARPPAASRGRRGACSPSSRAAPGACR